MKIENINQFLDEIKKLENKNGNSLFYRGHSNKEFKLEPSIYRKNDKGDFLYIENEDKIYRETIAKVPYDFKGKNTIESLVLMQHYGVPTRILDLTTNPLVALYFACVGNEDKDGEVIVFDIPQESTCYFDSDRVTVLANLAKCDSVFYYRNTKIEIYKQYNNELNFIIKKVNLLDSKSLEKLLGVEEGNLVNYSDEKIEDFLKQIKKRDIFTSTKINYKIKNFIKEIKDTIKEKESFSTKKEDIKSLFVYLKYVKFITILENRISSFINEEISSINMSYFRKLLNFIKEDKSYFQDIINPNDVESVLAIKPKLDNPRIIRQYGAFLIFGAKESNKEMPKVENYWIIAGKNAQIGKRIIIDHKSKGDILKELDKLGINKSTLFPEIDKVADYIKEKYTQE